MFDDFFDGVERRWNQRKDEFKKLACEPCLDEVFVGSRVLLSAGVLGRGFEWERKEATVLEVASTAYFVRFAEMNHNGEPDEQWVHRFAVTDVLETKPNE